MNIIIGIILTYLYGSIPFTLLVGFLYKVDLRKVGSGNIGGTNLGRNCGKISFFYSFILDGSKGAFAFALANFLQIDPLFLIAFALLGHSFSIFINFKGGKGVATAFGFVLFYSPLSALFAIIVFIIVLKISKYVSLSAVIAIGAYFILSLFTESHIFSILAFVIWMAVIYLHKDNMKRIKNKTERKITWM